MTTYTFNSLFLCKNLVVAFVKSFSSDLSRENNVAHISAIRDLSMPCTEFCILNPLTWKN